MELRHQARAQRSPEVVILLSGGSFVSDMPTTTVRAVSREGTILRINSWESYLEACAVRFGPPGVDSPHGLFAPGVGRGP